jgi:multidrug efflux system membrane fusion protein
MAAPAALITSGNLVTAGDSASVLTTLVSQKTVYVYFDVDESTYLHYQNLARSGQGRPAIIWRCRLRLALLARRATPSGQSGFSR